MHTRSSRKTSPQPHVSCTGGCPNHTHHTVTTGDAGDLIESTSDGHFDNIPAPFVSDALKALAPTYFDKQDLADCELRLSDGHFLWANEFYLTFSSQYFAQVLHTKHEQQLHPDLHLVTLNNAQMSVIDLPIDPSHQHLLKDLLFAVRYLR